MNSEKEILESLKNDLLNSFPILIERFENALLYYSYRLTGDLQGAQDIVQDVFLKFYQKFWELQPIGYLSALLYRMTGNLSKNYIRNKSRKKEIALTSGSSTSNGIIEPVDSANHLETTEELEKIICEALDKIPEKQKEALILKVFQDKNYDEIAEILETSKNNVMVLIHRAHNAMLTDTNLQNYLEL